MSNEKFTIVKNRSEADVTVKEGQKVFLDDGKGKKKNDSGSLIIMGIILFFVSPFLVFRAMPTYGKILTIIYFLTTMFLFFEPRLVLKKDPFFLEFQRNKNI